jgi:hypothetical protein
MTLWMIRGMSLLPLRRYSVNGIYIRKQDPLTYFDFFRIQSSPRLHAFVNRETIRRDGAIQVAASGAPHPGVVQGVPGHDREHHRAAVQGARPPTARHHLEG